MISKMESVSSGRWVFGLALVALGCAAFPSALPSTSTPRPIRRFLVDYSPHPPLPRLLQVDLASVQPVLSPSDLEALAAAGVRAIAYLSIGEVEADDPVRHELPPSCIHGVNPHWGSFYAEADGDLVQRGPLPEAGRGEFAPPSLVGKGVGGLGPRIPSSAKRPAASAEVLSTCPSPYRIGLGEDPERLLDGYDPEAPPVREALRPDVAVAWLNGYRDPATGRVHGDLSYFRDWAARGRFAEWGARGYELMIITWENYDGQNPAYGPPTFGDYHISEAFVQDVAELSAMLADYPRTVYFVLATEFSTYPACRYDRTCADPLHYSDRYNAVTREYYDQLIPRLREAMAAIRARAPRAQVGIGFGGWLATFDENTPEEKAGRSFVRLFEPLIRESDWIFFQSMIGRRAAENGGLGNPDQIRMNGELFAPYGKPIGLAHYNPGWPYAERLDVMREDLLRMLDPSWLQEMRARGLRLFAFMRYGPMKYNGYGVLDLAAGFAGRFRETTGCVFLPLVTR